MVFKKYLKVFSLFKRFLSAVFHQNEKTFFKSDVTHFRGARFKQTRSFAGFHRFGRI